MIDHTSLIETAHELDPLPASVVRLSQLVFADEPDMDEISQTIALDPVLAGRVVRLANFVTGGSRVEIVDVHQAVVRAGTSVILSLAVGASARGTVDTSLPELGIAEGELWRHSCGASLAAESLRRFSKVRVPAASTAALLHDIGKLLLARHLPKDWLRLRDEARAAAMDPESTETELLGVNHAELGGLIAEYWQLPADIQRGIRYHHSPAAGDHPVCDAVHVADAVAHRALEPDASQPAVREEAMARLGIDEGDLESLTEIVGCEIDSMVERFDAAAA